MRDAMEGMEALGEAIERGEVPLEAEDKAEDWEEERKRMNCEGEEVVIKKWEPVPVTRELEEKVMGRREDAALLASESESEEVPQLVESEEENDYENDENDENDDEVEEEDNEDNKEEYNEDNEDNEDNEEMEEENEDTTKTTSKAEQEAAAAKEREEVRQRRIAMARKVLSTRVLTPKDYRILNADESSSSDEEVEVANAMVPVSSPINRSITTRSSTRATCWATRRSERIASRWARRRGSSVGATTQGHGGTEGVPTEAEGRRHHQQGEGAKEELHDGEAELPREEQAEAEHPGTAAGRQETGPSVADPGKEGQQEKKNISRLSKCAC